MSNTINEIYVCNERRKECMELRDQDIKNRPGDLVIKNFASLTGYEAYTLSVQSYATQNQMISRPGRLL